MTVCLSFFTLVSGLYAGGKSDQSGRSTVYYNGTVITMTENGDGTPHTAEAVCIADGKITATGTYKEAVSAAGRNPVMQDLKGRTMLPGFLDSHSHISSYAQTFAIAQLGRTQSFDDIVSEMSAFLKESHLKPGEWLVGFGYDHNALKEKIHPTREVLDRISRDIPIAITHTSGHMGVFNTKALELCGITAQTPNPKGGMIARENGTQNPNGYMEEQAFMQYSARIQPPAVDFAELVHRAEEHYFSYGITSTQDALMGAKEFALMMPLADSGAFRIDVTGYVDLRNAKEYAQKYAALHNVYKNHFKIGGYKIFLDGSPQGRTAWLTRPYLPVPGAAPDTPDGDPAYKGYPVYTDSQIESFIRQSLADGMSLHAHCNGDAAADQFIGAFEKVIALDHVKDTFRPTMIHCQLIRPDQFPRMTACGMIASLFPAHVWYWGDIHLANLGPERGGRISAVHSALQAGTVYTFHQDTPVIPPDMMETLWCAVNRVTKEGVQLSEAEKVTPYEGLKALTVNGAYEIWEENSKGTIEPGKRADLVILDRNPLTVPPMDIRTIRVMTTLKDGVEVYNR